MERADQGMPFLLQYENVAWYEKGCVRILDRRIYPTKVNYVTCYSHQEVAQAIADMVTQSAGPYTAAGMGMALAAYEVRAQKWSDQLVHLQQAANRIAHARPTTANRMQQITDNCLRAANAAQHSGDGIVDAIVNETIGSLNRRYRTMRIVGRHLLSCIPKGGKVLTQCFGETIIGTLLSEAKEQGHDLALYCSETRPYLQGARLTASCGADLGFATTVLTDNMVGYAMEYEGIDLFTSAADTIACDGYIANKIGTKQMAILAHAYQIPYYVTGIPDADKQSMKDITIEQRDPNLVTSFQGVPHTLPNVQAIYPSFDMTPPELITGIITDRGIYQANQLADYFTSQPARFY